MLQGKNIDAGSLHRLVYVSRATTMLDRAARLHMLKKFRSANQIFDITGMLLLKGDDYMQLLEGPKASVLSLFARIQIDPRNADVVVVAQEEIYERQFANWSMAFRDLDSREAMLTPGYSDFLNIPFHTIPFILHPNRCQELLLVFRTTLQ